MSKSRYRISRRNRAVIGGVIIALGSIYALAVSYNIPGAELLWFLVGSALVLLAAMLAAMMLVLLIKGLGLMWRKLLPGSAPSASRDNASKDHDS
ncbi:MAG: hypothetical protein WD071_13940 [Pseudohongiella sp.]|uniref:hypothetical protein n=1 Tax=Pseudohongiella sp. TaxID=1979412 RepID=UPI0034A0498D